MGDKGAVRRHICAGFHTAVRHGSGALPEVGRRWGMQMGHEGAARRHLSTGVRAHWLILAAVGWLPQHANVSSSTSASWGSRRWGMQMGVEAAPWWELGAQRDATFVQAFGSGALAELGRRWGMQLGVEGARR